MAEQQETVSVYIRADGSETPPLLMTPPAEWNLKTFTKLGVRSVGLRVPKDPVVINVRTQQELDLATPLGEAGLLPFDVIAVSNRVSN